MIVALGFCSKDAAATRDMLLWCEQLGGCRDFDVLLVTDPSTQWSECIATLNQAARVFRVANFTATDHPVHTWPEGPNALFKAAAAWCQKEKQPFLWMESDAIPLRAGWLPAIHNQYNAIGNPFMGCIYGPSAGDDPGLPKQLMSGIGVYPANVLDLFGAAWNDKVAWDVATAGVSVASCTNTGLIQWFWGKPNLAPTFVMAKGGMSPVNAFTLDYLYPVAVLFHRNKDGTLIQCLRDRAGISRNDDFIVLCSFTRHDAPGMVKVLHWIAEMGTPRTHDALLWYESGTGPIEVRQVSEAAQRCFKSVYQGTYRDPGLGPNGAWMSAARQMHSMRRPWLWMEPDAVPLTEGWLSTLQARYRQQSKLFMGPVVRDMGHMNGTGVYPWNAATICQRTMAQTARGGWAWDMVMKEEMIYLCHDCSDLYQHAWIEENGTLQPHGHGTHPTFPTRQSLARLQPSAVIFHRNKDLTLIDRLREKRATP